jgi:pantothenate kinase
MPVSEFVRTAFVARLAAYLQEIPAGQRRSVGIAGAPASGKSTLAADIHRKLNSKDPGACEILPMDGYHYDDEVLVPHGWRPHKGAPHTFDVGGLRATLQRLKANDEETVAVPRFDRSIEIARAGAILIEQDARLIVCEGNYLLLKDEPWPSLWPFFDRTALIKTDYEELVGRNRQRWVDHDYTEEMIMAKLEENDLPNVRLVYERSAEPDWLIRN